MLCADGGGDEIVEVRGVAEDEDAGELLVFAEFAEELQGFGAGKQQIRFLDFLFRVFETFGEKFGRLQRA